jgi:Na+-translocating ferredoxin:NAD+ oxidoreductase subunit G
MDTSGANAVKTLIIVGLVAVAAALLVTGSYEVSHERIETNRRERLLRDLYSVLDPALRARGLAPTHLLVSDRALGTADPVDVFVVTDESGRAAAAIFVPVAPAGYNAPIRLLVGISPQGVVTGVRVLSHRETPGLGDAIELRKSPWVLQFDGKHLGDPPSELWAVRKDDGAFDGLTGATVTPRAVVRAVHDTLVYFERNRESLFAEAARAAVEAEP